MKIKHLKSQLKTFTLASGKSLYLYPMAENIEISEQDFYLSSKLQRYIKDSQAVEIEEEEIQEEVKQNQLFETIEKDFGYKKKFKHKKQKASED